ncbi:SRPBCC family protein [Sinomonas sp. ASV322]|uniref:SRPBCC family protein n=1 Tax=Sinomonas sp. ASV322 TaxID=3041920 RepID=UPI0027DBAC6D|nr:SRPBCC family protein [Sinomonas sp. ASV322]MDQ4501063.1 SRPBCC family protein [Sinomonas sp. ASV322]
MEFGSIEREIYIEAAPEIVFDVVSNPEHVREWWPDEALYEPAPGAIGEIVFGDRDTGSKVVRLTVVDVQPPRSFSFRWTHPADAVAADGNSLLVTFELIPSGAGTLLSFRETGFREMGWEVAVLEEQYRDHVTGWDYFLPRIAPYIAALGVRP